MSQDITVLRSAYRRLLRHAYRAVLFSVPGRYQVRDRLRLRFRGPSDEPARNRFRLGPAMSGETPRGTLDMAKVENTIDFLKRATETTGMEHKILKNLVWVWWGQQDVNLLGRKLPLFGRENFL
ncbi:hypothetical protein K470DRAFT_258549 [Piedraia hortae CBS 480.64]|uniref:DUF1763-domain-containing protein n=1 Tax=Piedraia hortae CBS 480.64 TaxID=1314780 RepID=A0A6A7BYD0_9PEZI|nr:hypothetical protein K470DRAFT_258549 [Piedraia hortae CBS 480.64]